MSGMNKVTLRAGIVLGILGVLAGLVGKFTFGDHGGGAADALWGVQMVLFLLCAVLLVASLAIRLVRRGPGDRRAS